MDNVVLSLEERRKFALQYLESVLRLFCPKRLGNLSRNAITIINDSQILIGNEIVDYAQATNEKWEDERWHGKKNPNEGWVDNALEAAKPMLVNIFSGDISEEEIQDIIKSNDEKFEKQFKDLGNFYENN